MYRQGLLASPTFCSLLPFTQSSYSLLHIGRNNTPLKIQVFLKFQQQEYYQKVNDLLYEYYGWDHCYKQIKIIYTPEGVREAYPELEAKLQKELLNEKICEVVDENAKNTFQKSAPITLII